MSINHWIGTGNLTRDPELRQTQSGVTLMRFGIAVNDRQRNKQTGQYEEYTNFIDCTMFGNRAQGLFEHLSKGMKIGIEGRLHWSQWGDEGAKKSKLEVIVENVEFLSGPRRLAASQPEAAQQGQPAQPQPAAAPVQVSPAPAPEANVVVPDSVYADAAAAEAAVYDGIPF